MKKVIMYEDPICSFSTFTEETYEILDKTFKAIEENFSNMEFYCQKYEDNSLVGGYTYKLPKSILDKAEVFIRVLDGIMGCSKSSLNNNHALDLTHRKQIKATPIHFDSIENFYISLNLKIEHKAKICKNRMWLLDFCCIISLLFIV
jgi:hypothetical protein